MKVVTDYDGCRYITAGKEYELLPHATFGQCIIHDEGRAICIKEPNEYGLTCAHLDEIGHWRYADAEPETSA